MLNDSGLKLAIYTPMQKETTVEKLDRLLCN